MDFESKFDPRPTTDVAISDVGLDEITRVLGQGEPRTITKLGGGFSSANFLIEFEETRCVARLAADVDRLLREADLVSHVAKHAPTVPVPDVLHAFEETIDGVYGCAIMSFCEGSTLDKVEDALTKDECKEVCEQVAQHAASIHKVEFSQNGFLGRGPVVTQPFTSYVAGTVGFMERCLGDERVKARIGDQRSRNLLSYLSRDELHLPATTQRLTHSDFNQKNILVNRHASGRWFVSAILDWEFALSASGIMDVGNLLRFESESPGVDADWFAAAYKSAGGELSENWRSQAIFADLLPQFSFVLEGEERPKTTKTAIGVIDRYISELDRA